MEVVQKPRKTLQGWTTYRHTHVSIDNSMGETRVGKKRAYLYYLPTMLPMYVGFLGCGNRQQKPRFASMDLILAAMTWDRNDSGRGDENIDGDATCDSLHAEAINSTRCGTREAGQEGGQRKQTVYVVVRPNGCVVVQPVCDMIMAM